MWTTLGVLLVFMLFGALVPSAIPFMLGSALLSAALVVGMLGDRWIRKRYGFSLLKALESAVLALIALLLVVALGVLIIPNLPKLALVAVPLAALVMIGVVSAWLLKRFNAVFKRRFNRDIREVLLLGATLLAVGFPLVFLTTAALHYLDVVLVGVGILVGISAGIVALVWLLFKLAALDRWMYQRLRVGLFDLLAHAALIPMAVGAVLMLVRYTDYAFRLVEGGVVNGEIVALDADGSRIQYRFDPNYGDPPDVRTHWQTVPPEFFARRAVGDTLPIYFLYEDRERSSVTLFTDALESVLLAVILILGTPLWAVFLAAHHRRMTVQPPVGARAADAMALTT